jgi:glutamate 5-kinase
MHSKLAAAQLVTRAGGAVIIAPGRKQDVLSAIAAGESVGTLFLPSGRTKTARRRWIALTARPRGHLVVDPGARSALESLGKSLLPIGVLEVVGQFKRGDVVAIRDPQGDEFARGLTNYSADEARKIRGLKSDRLPQILGDARYEEIIHRDNLALTR